MSPVVQTLHQFLASLPGVRRLVVALSGGADSSALLCAVLELELDLPVLAVHVHHGLSDNAGLWQAHCEAVCQQLRVPLVCAQVQVVEAGTGPEDAARRARMQALFAQLAEGDLLVTAHHREDQAETLLLRLARGAGLHGLAAIRPLRRVGKAWLGRPFLALGKRDLLEYLQTQGIGWIDDESNASDRFDRNYLRNRVLPLLGGRWPGFTRNASRAAELLGEAGDLLASYGRADLEALGRRPERLGESLLLNPLRDFPPARRHHLLRLWLNELGYRLPSQRRLLEIDALLKAGEDRAPRLLCGDCELRRFRERLFCLPAEAPRGAVVNQALDWSQVAPLRLPGGFELVARPAKRGLRGDLHYQVGFRAGTLRAHPHGRAHSQTLKKLLQEYQLEPWLRPWVPLVLHEGRLAAVGDLWVEKDYWVEGQEQALHLEWRLA